MRSCTVVLSMVAAHAPQLVVERVELLLDVLGSACGRLEVSSRMCGAAAGCSRLCVRTPQGE